MKSTEQYFHTYLFKVRFRSMVNYTVALFQVGAVRITNKSLSLMLKILFHPVIVLE